MGNLNTLPVKRKIEISTAIQSFLLEGAPGLIFRLYLPNDRLLSDELSKLLSLFQEQLSKTLGLKVTLNEANTNHGVSYSFYGGTTEISKARFANALSEFNDFLKLCVDSPEAGIELLKKSDISDSRARNIDYNPI